MLVTNTKEKKQTLLASKYVFFFGIKGISKKIVQRLSDMTFQDTVITLLQYEYLNSRELQGCALCTNHRSR